MSTLRVSNIEAKADVSSPTVDEKIKFTNSSGDVLFHLDGKTSGITTVGINTTGNTFTVNNTTGDISFSGSVTSSGVSTFTSDVSIADKIVHIGDTDTAIRFPAADTITAETGGTERLRITSGGQLVVTPADTTSSYATTDGGIDNAINISSTGTSSSQSAGISFSLNKSGETGAISEIGAIREGSGLSGLVFRTRDNSTGRNERLRINSSGNIGIGTDNPGTKIHIKADSDTTESVIRVNNNSNNNHFLIGQEGTSGYVIKSTLDLRFDADYDNNTGDTGSNILFRTDGSEKVRINSSGWVGIGTDAPLHTDSALDIEGSTPVLRISSTGNYGSLTFSDAGNDHSVGGIVYSHTDDALMLYGYNNTERLRITSGGFVNIGGNFTQTNYTAQVTRIGGNTDTMQIKGSTQNAFIRFTDNDASSDYTLGADDGPGSDDNNFIVYDRNASAYRLVLRSDGNFGIGVNNPLTKLHVGSGNIKVDSGYGIDFSSTGNGLQTMSSELLDDYEEGTCTLYLATSSKTSQISSSGGTGITYTKIGRKIHIYGYIVFSNVQSTLGGNHVHLWGFPYNFSSLGNSVDNGIWVWTNGTAPTNYWDGKFPGISCNPNLDGGGMYSHGYNGYIALNGNNIGNNGLHFNFDYTYQI